MNDNEPRILLVSGIFAMPYEYRSLNLQETTETLLHGELRRRGLDVEARGHAYVDDWSGYDVVHMHHLANSCVRMLLPVRRRNVVFSRHATKNLPLHRKLVLDATYRHAGAIVVSSEMEARRLAAENVGGKIAVIPNAVNTDNFTARLRTWSRAKPLHLLYVGQLIELKRVHQAVELVADLRQTGIDADLRIVSHRETLRSDLEALAAALDVRDHVQFLGARDRRGIGREMDDSHFLVLPSRTEARSTVVTEAALAGLPVLSYDVGGMVEQVPSDWEVPDPGDQLRFTDLAKLRIADYERAASTWFAHSRSVRDTLSIERMADAHLAVYRDLAGRASSR